MVFPYTFANVKNFNLKNPNSLRLPTIKVSKQSPSTLLGTPTLLDKSKIKQTSEMDLKEPKNQKIEIKNPNSLFKISPNKSCQKGNSF